MKALRRRLGRDEGHVLRKRSVQRLSRALNGRAALDVDARYLPRRVDSGVGPTRHGKPFRAREDHRERLAKDTLDRPLAGLPRPAAEARPVVLECQLEIHPPPLDIDMKSPRLGSQRMEATKYDLYSDEFRATTHETYASMRAQDPILRQPGLDGETPIWFLTRYEDVVAMLLDDERFVLDPALALTPEELEAQTSPIPPELNELINRTS